MKKDIIILDLFSGIGGFSLGLKEAGFNIKKHYFSEIDKHAIAVYQHNFKNAKYVGSVIDIRGNKLRRPNIITFGSPCQDFSLAGKRKGMEGQRSSLITEAIRLISECRPDFFVWENVKGAFSSNNGADFWAIIKAFANIGGYRLEWQLLNTSWFLPQNRERIYLVGHLAKPGRNYRPVFPIGENEKLSIKEAGHESQTRISGALTGNLRKEATYIVKKQASTLTGGGNSGGLHSDMTTVKVKSATKKGFEEAKEGDSINFSVPNSKTRRGRVGREVAQTLDTQWNQGVIQINSSKESDGKQPYQQNRCYDTNGLSPSLDSGSGKWSVKPVLTPNRKEKRQNGRRFKEDGEPSFTLNCQDQHGIMTNDSDIRRLTEIECERLQGFPDNWTKFGLYDGEVKEVSKTQRYKQLGNAVTKDVVQAIGKKLIKYTNQ